MTAGAVAWHRAVIDEPSGLAGREFGDDFLVLRRFDMDIELVDIKVVVASSVGNVHLDVVALLHCYLLDGELWELLALGDGAIKRSHRDRLGRRSVLGQVDDLVRQYVVNDVVAVSKRHACCFRAGRNDGAGIRIACWRFWRDPATGEE